jgi:hypothetical protein
MVFSAFEITLNEDCQLMTLRPMARRPARQLAVGASHTFEHLGREVTIRVAANRTVVVSGAPTLRGTVAADE